VNIGVSVGQGCASSAPNLIIAAATVATRTPIMKRAAAAEARSACGANSRTAIAPKAIADAPPGQAVTAGAAEIGAGEDDASTEDADRDLAGAGDREQEGLSAGAADQTQIVAGDDRRRVAGECRRVRREIAQHRHGDSAAGSPNGEAGEIADPALREDCSQDHRHNGADERTDQPVPALAQRGAELRLAEQRRRRAGPIGIVELKPIGDVSAKETEAHNRRPNKNAERARRHARSASVRKRANPDAPAPPSTAGADNCR
jgi:hypothetical protein